MTTILVVEATNLVTILYTQECSCSEVKIYICYLYECSKLMQSLPLIRVLRLLVLALHLREANAFP